MSDSCSILFLFILCFVFINKLVMEGTVEKIQQLEKTGELLSYLSHRIGREKLATVSKGDTCHPL